LTVKAEQKPKPIPTDLETNWCYFKGEIMPLADAKVSVATHALNYGTACFEGIRAYWNNDQQQMYVLKMREHYQRFLRNCGLIKIKLNQTVEDLCNITLEVLRKNQYKQDVYIRPLAFKATPTIKLMLSGLEDEVTIYTFPMGNYVDISSGLNVSISSWQRINDNAIPARGKICGAYVNSALAVDDALQAGFDEAIFLTKDGNVSEGSSCNLFIIRGKELITPAVTEDILEGITRAAIIELVSAEEDLGLRVIERPIDRSELYQADEVFFCGTGVQVSPVTRIDDRAIGNGTPGKFTLEIQKRYFAAARGDNDKYMHWVTPVY